MKVFTSCREKARCLPNASYSELSIHRRKFRFRTCMSPVQWVCFNLMSTVKLINNHISMSDLAIWR